MNEGFNKNEEKKDEERNDEEILRKMTPQEKIQIFKNNPLEEDFLKKSEDLMNVNIEDKDHFLMVVVDAKVQFNTLRLFIKTLDDEAFIAYNKRIPYLGFTEYLKSIGKTISPKLLEDSYIQSTISYYDTLIQRVRDITSKDEFTQILEEVDFALN